MQPDEAKIGFSGVYCIHRNSLLTPVETIDTGYGPRGMAVDPPGRFVYVTNNGSGDVSMYTINASTGGLNVHRDDQRRNILIRWPWIAPTGLPNALNSSNDVSIYAIDTYRGTLTSAGEVTAGVGPPSSMATTGTTQ